MPYMVEVYVTIANWSKFLVGTLLNGVIQELRLYLHCNLAIPQVPLECYTRPAEEERKERRHTCFSRALGQQHMYPICSRSTVEGQSTAPLYPRRLEIQSLVKQPLPSCTTE